MITVKTSEDVPYGILTLKKEPIIIDDNEWITPCHYILSHMFPSGIFKQSIVRSHDIEHAYADACDKINIEINNFAIVEYIENRCKNDVSFTQELLKTGNSKLFSVSFQKNAYGKFLEQKRFQLQSNNTNSTDLFLDRSNDPIYYMYLAERALKELLHESDLQYLVEENFQRMSDLLRFLEKKYGKERIFKKAPDRATILQIHKQRGVDYTTNPTTLIKLVRRQNIRRIISLNENKLKDFIFSCFIDSIRHLHPAEVFQRNSVIDMERSTIPFEQLRKFISRTFELYKNDLLPLNVIQIVKKRHFFLLCEEEIKRFESEIFPLHPGLEKEREYQNVHNDNAKQLIDVNNIHIFNPFAVHYTLINGFNFPTLVHFCVFKNISHERLDLKPENIFQKINSVRPDQIIQMLNNWILKNRLEKMEKIVDKTISKFLQNNEYEHLLLSTEKSNIVIQNNWFPKLGEKFVQHRSLIQPKINRITSLEQIKCLPIIKCWMYNQKQLIFFIKQIFDDWLKTKHCSSEITLKDIFKYFFNSSYESVDEYILVTLEKLRKISTDLQIYSYIFTMQYNFCNKWVKRKSQPKLADDKYNSTVVAICKLLLVFDRLTNTLITLDEVDVDFAKKLLTNTSMELPEEYFENVNDNDEENNSEIGSIDYNENDFDDFFEGHDEIYKFLANKCHNNLSTDIETYIYDIVKKINVDQKIRSRINFFAT